MSDALAFRSQVVAAIGQSNPQTLCMGVTHPRLVLPVYIMFMIQLPWNHGSRSQGRIV